MPENSATIENIRKGLFRKVGMIAIIPQNSDVQCISIGGKLEKRILLAHKKALVHRRIDLQTDRLSRWMGLTKDLPTGSEMNGKIDR